MTRARWWQSPHWRKAPYALVHHRSALVAVSLAGFLVALAAASAPFVTTATASAALKNKLLDLAPLATGLQISSQIQVRPTGLAAAMQRRSRAAQTLADELGLDEPVVTARATTPSAVLNGNGDARVTLMARSGVLGHVTVLSRTRGDGVWIADITAHSIGLRPGGVLRLEYAERGAVTRTVGLRVKGIYRALDRSAPDPYWANFVQEIYPQGVDPPPPQRFVFMSFSELFRTVGDLSTVQTFKSRGRTLRFAIGPGVAAIDELAVGRHGLTLARARALTRRLDAVKQRLAGSAVGRDLGCAYPGQPAPPSGSGRQLACTVSSSLSSAVQLADADAAAISPIVSLLSAAGIAITLAVAAAAGFFLVRRRRAEAALLFARGEHVATFTTRSAVEMFLPMLAGAGAGFGVALAVTGIFAPSGSIDAGTLSSAAAHAAVASAAALGLAAAAAAGVFVHLHDTGLHQRRWLRWVPWELPLIGIGIWLLHDVLSGGGMTGAGNGTSGHPTRAVFVLPLVLVGAGMGIVSRLLRLGLYGRRSGAGSLPPWLFLAMRRLAAGRALLTALLVVSAVSFGAYFYAQALARSVDRSVDEKAYMGYGGDVQGFVSDTATLPRRFAYPATQVTYASQVATLADGTTADVLAVDPATLGSVMRWYDDWGPDPRPRLSELAAQSSNALPAIVTRSLPAGARAISLQGRRVPIRVVARVSVFPGMAVGVPLVVVARSSLDAAAARAHVFAPLGVAQNFVWAKGPPRAVARAVAAPPIQAAFVTTVDDFRRNPDVLLATRTFTYMRLIAAAAGVLVFVGLLLYLQARQRSQTVASALAARMGLGGRAESLSLSIELAAIALVAAVVGAVGALLTAKPIVRHIDPLADFPPAPASAFPVLALVWALVGLAAVAFLAGVVTSWRSRRANPSEAIRVV